jgi:hypothetical protein
MAFVKQHGGKVPRRTGEDDEEPPSELLQLLECCYEEKTSHELGMNSKKVSQAEKARKAREAGETFRKAAFGEYVRNKKTTNKKKRVSISSSSPASDGEEEEEMKSDDEQEMFVTPARGEKRSVHHLASLRNLGGAAVERAQAKTLKEENKKAKIEAWKEIEQEKLALEKQRLDMEQQRRSDDHLLLLQILAEIQKNK